MKLEPCKRCKQTDIIIIRRNEEVDDGTDIIKQLYNDAYGCLCSNCLLVIPPVYSQKSEMLKAWNEGNCLDGFEGSGLRLLVLERMAHSNRNQDEFDAEYQKTKTEIENERRR